MRANGFKKKIIIKRAFFMTLGSKNWSIPSLFNSTNQAWTIKIRNFLFVSPHKCLTLVFNAMQRYEVQAWYYFSMHTFMLNLWINHCTNMNVMMNIKKNLVITFQNVNECILSICNRSVNHFEIIFYWIINI